MVSAVVLAAGAATRFGSAKQLLLLPHVLERLCASSVEEIVVVSGAYPLEASLRRPCERVRIVSCDEWALGPGASLRCGLRALDPESETALVVLADGPFLDPRAIERVLDHRHAAAVVVATYDGIRGHPAAFARSAWADIPDDGGRSLAAYPVACDDLTPPGDFDTPELAEGL